MKREGKFLRRIAQCCLLIGIVSSGLTGCGSSSDRYAETTEETKAYDYSEEVAGDTGAYESGEMSEVSEAVTEENISSSAQIDTSSSYNRKVIKTGNMMIQTKTFKETVDQIVTALKAKKGYVENMDISGTSYYDSYSSPQSATLTVRIPQTDFDQFMNNGSQFGNVINLSCNTEDITSQYVDTKRHLEVLETRYERLLELMKEVDDYEDIFKFEKEISEVEYEINSYKGTLNNFDSLVDMATIVINIEEVREYTEPPEEVITVGDRIKVGIKESWESVLLFLTDLLVVAICFIPYLIILIPIALVIYVIYRRRKMKRIIRRKEEKMRQKSIAATYKQDHLTSTKTKENTENKDSTKEKETTQQGDSTQQEESVGEKTALELAEKGEDNRLEKQLNEMNDTHKKLDRKGKSETNNHKK